MTARAAADDALGLMQVLPAPGNEMDTATACVAPPRYELRFASLIVPGRALSFPCDARGVVELDALSDPARCNYFFARTSVGCDFGLPSVVLRSDD